VEWYWQGKTEELWEKPVPVPLCPPQIPHGLTGARTRVFVVRGRRLTAWAIVRPKCNFGYIFVVINFAYCCRRTASSLWVLSPFWNVVRLQCHGSFWYLFSFPSSDVGLWCGWNPLRLAGGSFWLRVSMIGEGGPCPLFFQWCPSMCLITEEKHGKHRSG
jgi:hypothetical protein